jgi:putative transposase
LINEMRMLHEKELIESLAWVLMPDHLHWLLIVNETHLSEIVRIFKGKSSFDLKKSFHLNGVFWQRGFYDHALRKEEDLRAAARYIVANPLRAGLVDSIADYPHWDAKWVVG